MIALKSFIMTNSFAVSFIFPFINPFIIINNKNRTVWGCYGKKLYIYLQQTGFAYFYLLDLI